MGQRKRGKFFVRHVSFNSRGGQTTGSSGQNVDRLREQSGEFRLCTLRGRGCIDYKTASKTDETEQIS